MPIYPRLRAVQVHVPRTGGQTVEAVLGCSYAAADMYGVAGDVELSHLTAVELAAAAPAAWAAYFRFAFVRDPWDRVVSMYHYCGGRPLWAGPRAALLGFPAYVRALVATDPGRVSHTAARHLLPQGAYLLGPDGAVLVDFVGRFECFERDLRAVCARVGFDPAAVPVVNASAHAPFHTYYTPDLVALVALVGRYDAAAVAAFGYVSPEL